MLRTGYRWLTSLHGPAHRGLRTHRRPADRRAGGPQRLDRLAVPPPVRLLCLPRGHPRHRGARALAAVPRGRVRVLAPLRRELRGPGDHVHHPDRCRRARRPDAPRRQPRRRRPPHPRDQRHGDDEPRVADPARLRRDPAVGPPRDDLRGEGHHRDRRTRQADPARSPAAGRDRPPPQRQVRRGRGRRAALLHHLGALPHRPRGARRPHRPDPGDRRRRRGVGRAVPSGRAAPARRTPLPADAAPAHARADRRHRRRPDHLAARGLRRGTQLGLPVLLAARRRPHADLAGPGRLHRRGPAVALLAAAHGRRRPRGPPDHVRRRRRPAAARAPPSTTCPGTPAPRRSGSATPPSASASPTCWAR